MNNVAVICPKCKECFSITECLNSTNSELLKEWYDKESVEIASNFCYRYEKKEQKEIAEMLGKFLIEVKISLDKKFTNEATSEQEEKK